MMAPAAREGGPDRTSARPRKGRQEPLQGARVDFLQGIAFLIAFGSLDCVHTSHTAVILKYFNHQSPFMKSVKSACYE